MNIVLSANDDNTDATNDRGENNCFQCTSCREQSFFTYHGLNQHLRSCLKKERDVIVTDSQPASSRAVNDLQSTTESQQHQNVVVVVVVVVVKVVVAVVVGAVVVVVVVVVV